MTLIKVKEAAERLFISGTSARRLVETGALPAYRIGGAYRIPEEAIEQYLAQAKVVAKPEGGVSPSGGE